MSARIAKAYDFWLSKEPPPGFTFALVECARDTGRAPTFAGQKIGEPSALVHAAYALRAGFASQQFDEEQGAMAAHALMDLLLQTSARLPTLSPFERETLMHIASGLDSDPLYRAARAYCNSAMERVLARVQAAHHGA